MNEELMLKISKRKMKIETKRTPLIVLELHGTKSSVVICTSSFGGPDLTTGTFRPPNMIMAPNQYLAYGSMM